MVKVYSVVLLCFLLVLFARLLSHCQSVKGYILALLFSTSCILIVDAQSTQFNFVYQSGSPGCNPFKDEASLLRSDSKWKVSHGTPEVKDYFNNLFYNVGKLRAEKSNTGVEKSEGLYIDYAFKCTHAYDVTIALRHGDGDNVGFKLSAVKTGFPASNSSCGLDPLPASNSKVIYQSIDAYNSSLGDFKGITISDFTVDNDNLNAIWIYAYTGFVGQQGSIYIDYVTIVDKGFYRSVCPVPPPSVPSEYPPLTGLEIRPGYFTLADGTTNYEFLFNPLKYSGEPPEDKYRGYGVKINDQFAWHNYDEDGDVFTPEFSDEGKVRVPLQGKFCVTYKWTAQEYFSSGAPFSKWTESAATHLVRELKNSSFTIGKLQLPTSIPDGGLRIMASSFVLLKEGFSFSAQSESTTLNIKTIPSCVTYLSAGGREESGDTQDDIDLKIDWFYYAKSSMENNLRIRNPVDDFLHVYGLEKNKIYTYSIYNKQGILLETTIDFSGENIEHDMRSFASGLYILTITSGNRVESFKIVKK